MDNLRFYNQVRKVPQEAQKTIKGGRINGMTDINPMWRIKILTELFGPCGIGWTYTIEKQWIEDGANDEKSAFCNIFLRVKDNGEWSEPIPGTGGSSFVSQEKNGPYTSDECFKMALTDALSVACKALGIGADIYYEKDTTKYDGKDSAGAPPAASKKEQEEKTKALKSCIAQTAEKTGEKQEILTNMLIAKFGVDMQLPFDRIDTCIEFLMKMQTAHAQRVAQ